MKGLIMTKETMSLTEALAQLKRLDLRIRKATQDGCFINFQVGQQEASEFPDCDAVSALQKIEDLIKRREAIQKGKLNANSEVLVKIAGEEMTIAVALEKKQTIIIYKNLLAELREQQRKITSDVQYINDRVQERLDRQLSEAYGNSGKVREEDYEAISGPFLKNNKAVLIDPIGIQAKIDELDTYIDDFESEVDIRLSEINARTLINIEY
jgi:hypothetical protein